MATSFSCLCFNISAHFEILRNIVNDIKIKEFVKYHLKVINITHRLSRLNKQIILVEFTAVSLIICFTGIQILVLDDYEQIMAALFHCFVSITDAGIYAYCGQKVLDSSGAVSNEIYTLKKDYLPIIMMSQKKMKFDSGLFDASFETFSTMLSRTLSFMTVLKSFT